MGFQVASAQSGARNFGARHARGEILVFCDAHVEVPPRWWEPLYNLLRMGVVHLGQERLFRLIAGLADQAQLGLASEKLAGSDVRAARKKSALPGARATTGISASSRSRGSGVCGTQTVLG